MTKPEELPITPSPMDNTYTPQWATYLIREMFAVMTKDSEYKIRFDDRQAAECVAELLNEKDGLRSELAELRAENERMREAGDAMAVVLTKNAAQCGTPDMGEVEAVQSWEATRKPSQSSTKDTE